MATIEKTFTPHEILKAEDLNRIVEAVNENATESDVEITQAKQRLSTLESGLQQETSERIAAVQTEKEERVAAVAQETSERIAAVQTEKEERVAAVAQEAISREEGDATTLYTCKEYTDAEFLRASEVESSLQQQINAIISGDATVAIHIRNASGAEISAVFVNETIPVTVIGESSVVAESIVLKKSNEQLPGGVGENKKSHSVVDELTSSTVGGIGYSAVFTILGQVKTASKTVNVVYPIYYGAADAYTDLISIQHRASARTSVIGTYNIMIPGTDYKYIWFVIPSRMSITSAKMNGFEFSLNAPVNQDIGGVEYKVYRTPQMQEPGTYKIELS